MKFYATIVFPRFFQEVTDEEAEKFMKGEEEEEAKKKEEEKEPEQKKEKKDGDEDDVNFRFCLNLFGKFTYFSPFFRTTMARRSPTLATVTTSTTTHGRIDIFKHKKNNNSNSFPIPGPSA